MVTLETEVQKSRGPSWGIAAITAITASTLSLALTSPSAYARHTATPRTAVQIQVKDTNDRPVAGASITLEPYSDPGHALDEIRTGTGGKASTITTTGDDRLAATVRAPGYLDEVSVMIPLQVDTDSGAREFKSTVTLEAVFQPSQPGKCDIVSAADTVRCTFYLRNESPRAAAVTGLSLTIPRIEETCAQPGMFFSVAATPSGTAFFAEDPGRFGQGTKQVISGHAELDCRSGVATFSMTHAFPDVAAGGTARVGIELPRSLSMKDTSGNRFAVSFVDKPRTATASVTVGGGQVFAGTAQLAFEAR